MYQLTLDAALPAVPASAYIEAPAALRDALHRVGTYYATGEVYDGVDADLRRLQAWLDGMWDALALARATGE